MQASAGTVLLLLALSLANLPFLTNRIFLVRQPAAGSKSIAWRLFEILVFYFLLGALSRVLEASAFGSAFAQGWEFYAITFCLFLVFAFPGFVYRYLWHSRV